MTLNGPGLLAMADTPTLNSPVIIGNTDGSAPKVGEVGETFSLIVPASSPVNAINGVSKAIGYIDVPKGNWLSFGRVNFSFSGSVNVTGVYADINLTEAATTNVDTRVGIPMGGLLAPAGPVGIALDMRLHNFEAMTRIWLNAYANFTLGSVTISGRVFFRRSR